MKVIRSVLLATSLGLIALPMTHCASSGNEDSDEELEVSDDGAEMSEEDAQEFEEMEAATESSEDEVTDQAEPATGETDLTNAIQALEELDDGSSEVSPNGPIADAPPQTIPEVQNSGESQEVTVKSYALAVRDAPGGNVLRYIGHGEKVQVLERNGLWAKIAANEYVRSGFLKSPTDGPVGDGNQAFMVNTKALYIRSQPTSQAPVVGVLLEGETVKVVASDANGWSHLGQGRFIRSMFLIQSAGSAH